LIGRYTYNLSCSSLKDCSLVHVCLLSHWRIPLFCSNILSNYLFSFGDSVCDLSISFSKDILRFYRGDVAIIAFMGNSRKISQKCNKIFIYLEFGISHLVFKLELGHLSELCGCGYVKNNNKHLFRYLIILKCHFIIPSVSWNHWGETSAFKHFSRELKR